MVLVEDDVMDAPWLRELKRLHAENYSDWTSHLQDLNQRYDLGGKDRLAVPNEGLPPSWFVGDVEGLNPGEWALAVSLNQASWGDEDEDWRCRKRDTLKGDWDFWRLLNRKRWYSRFYAPMVRLAATALGAAVPPQRRQKQEFATTRIVFVESYPYSSARFDRGDELLNALVADRNPGVAVAERVRRLLTEGGRPALVMVNGNAAVQRLEAAEGDRLHLDERPRYESVMKPGKLLRHWEGCVDYGGGPVPVLGFPFLRTPTTHNWNGEIEQLGDYGRALIERSRGEVCRSLEA